MYRLFREVSGAGKALRTRRGRASYAVDRGLERGSAQPWSTSANTALQERGRLVRAGFGGLLYGLDGVATPLLMIAFI
jgi:hypothetical protein